MFVPVVNAPYTGTPEKLFAQGTPENSAHRRRKRVA